MQTKNEWQREQENTCNKIKAQATNRKVRAQYTRVDAVEVSCPAHAPAVRVRTVLRQTEHGSHAAYLHDACCVLEAYVQDASRHE